MQTGWVAVTPADGYQHVTLVDQDVRNVNFTNKRNLSLSGYKLDDCTNVGLPGWSITVKNATGSVVGTGTTDDAGYWEVCNLVEGVYNVSETMQTGWVAVNPADGYQDITLVDQDVGNVNFTNQKLLCVSGYKLDDCTNVGLPGWTITLNNSSYTTSTTTDRDGFYEFCNLMPGTYTVEETIEAGWTNSTPTSQTVILGCDNVTGADFRNTKLLCINGTKYDHCTGEGLNGWTITLTRPDGSTSTATTADGGRYSFCGLMPGTYTVEETVAAGWKNVTPISTTVTLGCDNVSGQDFVNTKLLYIEGYKLNILTKAGVEGWTINLYDAAKVKIATTTTDSTGKYQFCELTPGTYGISEEMQPDWINQTPTSIILGLACDNSTGNNFVNRPLPSCCSCPTVPEFSATQIDSLKIQFVDTTTGNPPVEYLWDFGDGTSSTDRNPVHQYTTSGTKKVTLYVKSVDCNGELSEFAYVKKNIEVTTGTPVDSITVAVPNGGEVYQIGDILPMSWTYTGTPGSTVKIDVFKGPTILKTLTGIPIGSSGSGTYSITIPSATPVGSDYKIRVTSTSNAAYTDISDAPFTIGTASGASIKVESPNGGEIWTHGSTQVISWSSTGNPGPTVKIEVLKGTSILKTLTDIPTTSGSINVPVPYNTPLGGDYKIRITSTNNAAYTDTSDAPFTISTESGTSIKVESPNGGEIWTHGSTQVISWSSTGNPGPTVKIEVLKGTSILKTLTDIPTTSGSINVPVPYNTPLGGDYKIRITSTNNAAYTDTSDAPFTISSAITVATPNGGEVYQIGDILPMSWTYTGTPGSTVNIDVYKGSDILKTLKGIPIGSAGSGTYSVTIPSTTPLGADYSIRVTSSSYSACTDMSDGMFSII